MSGLICIGMFSLSLKQAKEEEEDFLIAPSTIFVQDRRLVEILFASSLVCVLLMDVECDLAPMRWRLSTPCVSAIDIQ